MHKDYGSYTEEDFIGDEYFQQWVRTPDAENTAFWQQVETSWPDKRVAMLAARSFIENINFQAVHPSRQQVEDSLHTSLLKISVMEYSQNQSGNRMGRRNKQLFIALAAVFLGVIFTGGVFINRTKTVTIETLAGPQEVRTIVLPDSSVVTLNAGSHLTYSSDMELADHREVWLEGEGFFHVKPVKKGSVARRFTVHSGDMDIEVMGTTFNVKKAGVYTNVSLNSGKIKIGFKDDPGTAIYLQPGDFVRYSSGRKHILRKQVKPELYSVWKEEKIALDGMSLAEIARLLEDSYGYTTHIENNELAETKVSGTLVMKDEATLLQTLAFTLDIDIIKKDSVLNFKLKHKN
jgi:ferric-dicitrate binding protein FerR (iron transport regulator)